jgi:hypothetical protein
MKVNREKGGERKRGRERQMEKRNNDKFICIQKLLSSPIN